MVVHVRWTTNHSGRSDRPKGGSLWRRQETFPVPSSTNVRRQFHPPTSVTHRPTPYYPLYGGKLLLRTHLASPADSEDLECRVSTPHSARH